MLELFAAGFASVFTLASMFMITLGVFVGIIFGSIPGLTTTMAVALCLPLTFGMPPAIAMSLLMGLYIGGTSGGLISAILINIPGTPASVATCWDGHPMASRGEAGKALGAGVVFSFLGTLLSIVALVFIAPPLAEFALLFGPVEYFALALFALTMIGTLAGKQLAKGIVVGLLGLILAFVGMAPIDAFPRFTFGIHDLDGGFDILPALIGLFAVSEILSVAESDFALKKENVLTKFKMKGFGFSVKEFLGQMYNMFRSALIGIGIGILPGIGAGTSNIVAYSVAKSQDKHPEKYGTGCLDGVVASETSNNASIGGAMVPLLTLGVPGDTVTAMILGGLMIHGLTPGPLLFISNGVVVYGIFASLIIANFVMLIMEFFGIRVFAKLLSVPKHILLPVIFALCVVGAYGLNNRVFDVWVVMLFGVIGYVLNKLKFPTSPMILGIILGPMAETGFRRGMQMNEGNFWLFFTRPIGVFFFFATVFMIVFTAVGNVRNRRKEEARA
ncbi:MAG TPA: Tat pathway signal protein [Treponema sp.]|nr:MAG: Tat pathway signal protein [Treponema sp. RIFOXYC1_FULL_61_9]OHE70194.1 MAG: Tat pathway signal protein [Treponema sp. GWC1_61_84]HCM28425.1 Tat pathway signal protein [Treponema sp.]